MSNVLRYLVVVGFKLTPPPVSLASPRRARRPAADNVDVGVELVEGDLREVSGRRRLGNAHP
eukprot:14422772-Alexandrium_andersonii.AAC.1